MGCHSLEQIVRDPQLSEATGSAAIKTLLSFNTGFVKNIV